MNHLQTLVFLLGGKLIKINRFSILHYVILLPVANKAIYHYRILCVTIIVLVCVMILSLLQFKKIISIADFMVN